MKYAFDNLYNVVVETPDGTTYTQMVKDDFYSLLDLSNMLGDDYWIVDIYY